MLNLIQVAVIVAGFWSPVQNNMTEYTVNNHVCGMAIKTVTVLPGEAKDSWDGYTFKSSGAVFGLRIHENTLAEVQVQIVKDCPVR